MPIFRSPLAEAGASYTHVADSVFVVSPGMFKTFDDMFPVVSCKANFDEILIPADHVSRSPNDTYYVSSDKVLRCHTSAHQAELLRTKQPAFLVTGVLGSSSSSALVDWFWCCTLHVCLLYCSACCDGALLQSEYTAQIGLTASIALTAHASVWQLQSA